MALRAIIGLCAAAFAIVASLLCIDIAPSSDANGLTRAGRALQGAAKGVTRAAPNRIHSAQELIRRAEDAGPFHNFPESFDDVIFDQGDRTVVESFFNEAKPLLTNDSIQYQLPGSINGHAGMFEIFTRPSVSGNTEVITHRFFRPGP